MKKLLIFFTIIALSSPLFTKANSSIFPKGTAVMKVNASISGTVSTITKMEYWIDNNSATKMQQTISPARNFNWLDSLDMILLSDGLHVGHVRFCDNSGKWSSVVSSFFLKSGAMVDLNPKIVKMEYWIDNNSVSKMQQTIIPARNFNWLDSLDMNSLSDGLHVGHVRFCDNSGKWSSVVSSFFLKSGAMVDLNPNIEKMEYWIDNNSASKMQQTIIPARNFNWLDSLDMNSLSDGLHVGHVRFSDNSGKWSSVVSSFFLKRNKEIIGQPQITQMEYWLDGNSSSRNRKNTTNTNLYQWLDSLDMSSVNNGLHVGQARFRDNVGNWSSVISSFFVKSGNEIITNPVLTKLEYWIDNNTQQKNQKPFDADRIYLWQDSLTIDNIANGLHTFSVRFADAKGKWSSVQSNYFQLRNIEIKNNRISNYRYWFEIEPDYRSNITASNIETERTSINDSLDVANLPMGNQVMYFQFRDEAGKWSSVITDTISQNEIPRFNFTADNQQLCDSGIVNFTSDSLFIARLEWKFEENTSVEGFKPQHYYNSIGTHDVLATVWFKGGIDSLVYTQPAFIRVNPSAKTTTKNTIMYGDSLQFGGEWHKLPGEFTLNLQTQKGCDSTVILNLALTKAELLVMANDTTREMNSENPNFRLSYSGFVFNETPTLINTLPTATTNAVLTSSPGEYDVIVSGGLDDHYSFVYQAGKLTILGPNGLKNMESYKILLYPNPVDIYLSVKSDMATMKHISIMDVNGRILVQKDCVGSPTEYLKMDKLTKGLYIINIVTDKGITTGKIVKK